MITPDALAVRLDAAADLPRVLDANWGPGRLAEIVPGDRITITRARR